MVVVPGKATTILLFPRQTINKCQINLETIMNHLQTTASKVVVMIPAIVVLLVVVEAAPGTTEEEIHMEMEAPARTATTKDLADTPVVEEAVAAT